MSILLFVLIPLLAVTAYAVWTWARGRQPSSVEAGIDAFRREMTALSPDAAPQHRRVDPRPGGDDGPRGGPRRPGEGSDPADGRP